MPLIDESVMPYPVRIIIYFVGLIWSFLGVAIVADIFMCAIEGNHYFTIVKTTKCIYML